MSLHDVIFYHFSQPLSISLRPDANPASHKKNSARKNQRRVLQNFIMFSQKERPICDADGPTGHWSMIALTLRWVEWRTKRPPLDSRGKQKFPGHCL